jgi:hypothetical protein
MTMFDVPPGGWAKVVKVRPKDRLVLAENLFEEQVEPKFKIGLQVFSSSEAASKLMTLKTAWVRCQIETMERRDPDLWNFLARGSAMFLPLTENLNAQTYGELESGYIRAVARLRSAYRNLGVPDVDRALAFMGALQFLALLPIEP